MPSSLPQYEIVIPVGTKDFNKVKFSLSSLSHLSPLPQKIHIVAPNNGVRLSLRNFRSFCPINYHLDSDVLPQLNRHKCKHRSGWLFQQFIKLFNNLSSTDYYFVIDSDIYINKPLYLFTEDEKPKFFLTHDQYHQPYFSTLEKLLGISERIYPHSFIADFMMFHKPLIQSLLANFDDSVQYFYNYVCALINKDKDKYSFSEFETYGNFVQKCYPNKFYEIEQLKSERFVHQNREWSDREIEDLIGRMAPTDVQVFSFHTWI